MRIWTLPVLVALVGGCAYVTKGEYDEHLDADADGWPLGEDCAPDDDRIYPYAPDVRGDGCDSDCGMEPDADGDDWPDDNDCAPDDSEIYPCAEEEAEDDGVDQDCDGWDTTREDECAGTDPDFPYAPSILDGCDYPTVAAES